MPHRPRLSTQGKPWVATRNTLGRTLLCVLEPTVARMASGPNPTRVVDVGPRSNRADSLFPIGQAEVAYRPDFRRRRKVSAVLGGGWPDRRRSHVVIGRSDHEDHAKTMAWHAGRVRCGDGSGHAGIRATEAQHPLHH